MRSMTFGKEGGGSMSPKSREPDPQAVPALTGFDPGRVAELAEQLREAGDVLADELSILNLTSGISSRARGALSEWDKLSFGFRSKLREAKADTE